MKLYFQLLSVILCTYVNIASSKPTSSNDSIRLYYELVNKAELAIVDSAYNVAFSCYEQARKYKWLNADDLYNASVVAYLSEDTLSSIYYFNTLASYGLKKSDLEDRQWVSEIKNEPFYKHVTIDYDSIWLFNKNNSSKVKFGKMMIPFFIKDQNVRDLICDENGLPIAPAPENPNREISDHENAIEMVKYINKNGFPSFNQTGFFDNLKTSDASGTYWYLWWHRCPDKTLLNVSLKAVLSGEFPPDDYALSIDVCLLNNEKRTYHAVPDSSYSVDLLKVIDEKRKSIYLEPLSDYKRKFEFYESDRRFYLLNDFAYGLYQLSKSNLGESY